MLLSDSLLGFPYLGLFLDADDSEDDAEDDEQEVEEEEEEDEGEGKNKSKSKRGESENEDEGEHEDEEDEEDEEEWDPKRAMATIRKLRQNERTLSKQAKTLARKLKKYEDAEKKKADAEKSELQKALDKLTEATKARERAEQTLEHERVLRAVERAASKLGFIDPQDAYSLLSSEDRKVIEYDAETGKVSGYKKALKALAEEKPYLIDPDRKLRGTPPRNKRSATGKPLAENLDEQPAEEVLGVSMRL